MPQLAFLNGRFLPAAELTVAPTDAGFVQGVTVAEQLRTFGGQLFRLEDHLQRLRHCLEIIGLDAIDLTGLATAAQELAANNHALLPEGDDLGLCLFVTPGPYSAMVSPGEYLPTIAMHTFPVPFHLWADRYANGQSLVVTKVRQVPESCWSHELKCRSRMHYYLADLEARRREAGARALLLDQDDCVIEASTANVVIYRQGIGLVSPPRDKILPGVSVAVLEQLARGLGIPFTHRELRVEDVQSADEVVLSSTSPCLLPISTIDGRRIGSGSPGSIFRQALAAWSELVGLDIIEQACRFAPRRASGP